MKANIYIGTSGWHYNHWIGNFYPKEVTGYNELRFHSEHFNSVENNSSFYRIASESTYKTWDRMTPQDYKFSLKLNKLITHNHRLELNNEVTEKINYILRTTQILKHKLGAIVVQLPPSFRFDLDKLSKFLSYFTYQIRLTEFPLDVAIEFRNKHWFVPDVYKLLKHSNVALVASQSSRYPEIRQVTADIVYIRMHGPEKLFASKYSTEQLLDWARYITSIESKVKRIYVYFNNDFYGYAIENAKELMQILDLNPENHKNTKKL